MEDFQIKTSIWSENIEGILQEMKKSCRNFKIFNVKLSIKYHTLHNRFMYGLIILGPMSGILSSISTSEPDYFKVIQTFITVFSFFTGVLSGILKYSKMEEKVTEYKSLAAKYASLEHNINRQLSLDKSERVNPGEYLEWISSSYETLFARSPNVPLEAVESEKIEVVIDKNKNVDLDTYADGKMKYELARLNKN